MEFFDVDVHVTETGEPLAIEIECEDWFHMCQTRTEEVCSCLFGIEYGRSKSPILDVAVIDKLAQFGFQVHYSSLLPQDETRSDASHAWTMKLRPDSAKIVVGQGPTGDFYDRLRDLKKLLGELSEDIQKINEKLAPEVASARAHINKFIVVLDQYEQDTELIANEPLSPNESNGLVSRLKRVDWEKVSGTAQKIVDTIIKIINQIC